MIANDKEEVKAVITQFISILPSQSHSSANLNSLAASISARCGISASVLCYACIDTYPGQSEIRISFRSSGSQVEKTIDISNSPSDTRMIVLNMHY